MTCAKPEWLEQYEKGVADGIESAALLCEKAYGYETPKDIARRIRALVSPPKRKDEGGK
jgi:hypothetical protein